MKRSIYGLALLLATNSFAQRTLFNDSILTGIKVGYTTGATFTQAGAIDKVTQERMNKGLVISSLGALSGQAAGVQVTSGANQEAMVSAVRVRGTTSLTGNNDPLVIIDGVTSDLQTLSTIYPADIESFTILKDASETAQYGSRGAAGVIEVATKKGKQQKFHISYDGTFGFERVYKRINMLNAAEFRQVTQRQGLSILDMGGDTDYRKSIERTGGVFNHHIAFGGGNRQSNYRASIGMLEHKTVIRTNQYRSYIAKLDVQQKAFDDHATFDLGVFGSIGKNSRLPFKQKLFYSAATFNPTIPDGPNADGSYSQVTEALWISNPNALLKMKEDEETSHVNVHLRLQVDLGAGFLLTAFGSYSHNDNDNAHYYPTYVWSHGEAYRGDSKTEELLGNIALDKTFKLRHSTLNMMVLAEAQSESGKGFYTTVKNMTSDAFGYDNLSAGSSHPWNGTSSFTTDAHLESFLFHAQYSLLDRYTITANLRADASSMVGDNNHWGIFPSVNGAWVISDEQWMKPLTFIHKAKLRVGYGRSGNLGGITPYNSLELMQPNGIVPMNGSTTVTLGIIRNANPDLKWEIKRTFNAGIDLSLWDGRIALSLDYYLSKTTDMLYLYDVPVPPYPYDKLLANLGSMKNSGVEIGFGITPLRQKDMELSINMNWSFERNKLLSLNGYYRGEYLTAPNMKGISKLYGAGFNAASDVVMQVVGQPLGVFYLPHCKGIVTQPNGTKIYDVTEEKYFCGQATPKATMGSNIAFRYKQWDVTVQMNGAFGHKIYNGTALTFTNMLSLPNYNIMKGAPEKNIHDQTISDYWLESGNYVNIDYITVGWNIPVKWRYIQSMRLSCSVNNLATITGYSGLTPMINSSVIDGTLGIDDKNTMPVYRSYSLGFSIKF